MVKFSRRHLLQGAGATLAAWGLHQLPWGGQNKVFAQRRPDFMFEPPGFLNDFLPEEAQAAQLMRSRWHEDVNRLTERCIQNEPWNFTNQPRLTHYFNPATTEIPESAPVVPITWTTYPNRIRFYYPDATPSQHWEYADNGPPRPSFDPESYNLSGTHRDWQDEYAEWSITRNDEGKITRVQFTSETREYWYALWDVSPQAVLRLYRQLASDRVQLEDLYLRDEDGNPIIDPQTGRPAYDELNKWNGQEGAYAVHMIASFNILQGAMFLGAQSTILREDPQGNPVTDSSQLVNYGWHGTPNRNSDPFIGAYVNDLVRGVGLSVTLKNPVGIYLQQPNFRTYKLPDNAPDNVSPADFWKVVRGRTRQGSETYDYILHAVYEVPPGLGFTVGDITINGVPIEYGAQIADTLNVAVIGQGIPETEPAIAYGQVDSAENLYPHVLRERPLLKIAERSNLNIRIEQGSTLENIALKAKHCDRNTTIEFVDAPGVTAEVTDFEEDEDYQIFILTITADRNAPLGNRSLALTHSNGTTSTPRYGMIEVVARR